MSNINKVIAIPVIATLIVGTPLFLIDLQLSKLQVLIAIFLVSLASVMTASPLQRSRPPHNSNSKSKSKKPAPQARVNVDKTRRESGSVKWFNASKGFGFITRDSGDDIFVHFRSIRGEGHRVLHDGQRVEFVIGEGDKGLQAEDVAECSQ